MRKFILFCILAIFSSVSFAYFDTFNEESYIKRSDKYSIAIDDSLFEYNLEFHFKENSNSFIMLSDEYANTSFQFNEEEGYVYRKDWLNGNRLTYMDNKSIDYITSYFVNNFHFHHNIMMFNVESRQKDLNALLCADFRINRIIKNITLKDSSL